MAPIRLEEWNRLNHHAYRNQRLLLAGQLRTLRRTAREAEVRLRGAALSASAGRGAGVGPRFHAQEEQFGGPNAVLISDRLWRRRFGQVPASWANRSDSAPLRTPLSGVMPPTFQFPDRDVDLWTPSPRMRRTRRSRDPLVHRHRPPEARRHGGASARQPGHRAEPIWDASFPKTGRGHVTARRPLKDVTVGRRAQVPVHSVRIGLAAAADRLQQHRGAADVAGGRAAARDRGALLARRHRGRRWRRNCWPKCCAGPGRAPRWGSCWPRASAVFRTLAQDLPRIDEIGLNWRIVLYSLAAPSRPRCCAGLFPATRGTRRRPGRSLAQRGRSQVSRPQSAAIRRWWARRWRWR